MGAGLLYGAAGIVSLFGTVITAATGVGALAFGIAGGCCGYLTYKSFEAANYASYLYKKYGKYDLSLIGIGPVILGIAVYKS